MLDFDNYSSAIIRLLGAAFPFFLFAFNIDDEEVCYIILKSESNSFYEGGPRIFALDFVAIFSDLSSISIIGIAADINVYLEGGPCKVALDLVFYILDIAGAAADFFIFDRRLHSFVSISKPIPFAAWPLAALDLGIALPSYAVAGLYADFKADS